MSKLGGKRNNIESSGGENNPGSFEEQYMSLTYTSTQNYYPASGREGYQQNFSNKQEVSKFIADMTLGLRDMADQAETTFLAYLLDLAHCEAVTQSKDKQVNGDET